MKTRTTSWPDLEMAQMMFSVMLKIDVLELGPIELFGPIAEVFPSKLDTIRKNPDTRRPKEAPRGPHKSPWGCGPIGSTYHYTFYYYQTNSPKT